MEEFIKIWFCLIVATLASCRILPEQDLKLFQGDIVLAPEQQLLLNLEAAGIPTYAVRNAGRWPNPRSIPFEVHADLKKYKTATDRIAEAIAEIEQKSCLRFRPKTSSDKSGIIFGPGAGCSSPVGYNAHYKTNYISLAQGCWRKGIIVHEILHSMGFWHEQSRPDRDNYVKIHNENIVWAGRSQFRKMSLIDSMGSPYDYDSILHYGTYYFSNGKGKSIETLNPKDQNRIGQRRGMSIQDTWQLNKMYCEDKKIPSTTAPSTTGPSQPDTKVSNCIQHYGGLYVTVDRTEKRIKLTAACTDQFRFTESHALQHTSTKWCVMPMSDADASKLTLSKSCNSATTFKMTAKQSIMHVKTSKCIHPEGGSERPKDGTNLVIFNGCDQKRLQFALIKFFATQPPKTESPVATKYCIRHSGGLYMTVSDNQAYVQLTPTCQDHFLHHKNNSLQHMKSFLCIRPSRQGDGAVVRLSKTCDGLSRFKVTAKGSLFHVSSKKCVHPEGGSAHPDDKTVLVLFSGCNQERLRFNLVKVP